MTKRILAVAVCAALLWTVEARALPTPEVSLDTCQNAVKTATRAFVANKMVAIGTCLQSISTEIVKKNATDANAAAGACVSQFRRINDSRGMGKQLSDKLAAAVIKKCDPSYQSPSGSFPNTHTLADIIGTGAGVSQPLNAGSLKAWCSHYGGDGSIDSLQEWVDCITAAAECDVDSAIASQYPRALEWLNLAKPAMQALTPPAADPTKVADAVAGLDAVEAEIDGPDDDNVVSIQCGSSQVCGNDLAEGSEVCDGTDFHSESCATQAPATPGELTTIVVAGGPPTIDPIFGGTPSNLTIPTFSYWSSTTDPAHSTGAYFGRFDVGAYGKNTKASTSYYARAVRGGF